MRNIESVALDAERIEMLEGRLASRLAIRLDLACNELSPDIAERLRFGRELALVRARLSRQAAAGAVGLNRLGSTVALGGPPSVWLRLVSTMPLIVLVGGLVLIQQHFDHEQIAAAAEVDAALLADELPPAAYRDPGFIAYLQAQDDR